MGPIKTDHNIQYGGFPVLVDNRRNTILVMAVKKMYVGKQRQSFSMMIIVFIFKLLLVET